MRKILLKLTLSFLAVLFWSAGLYAQTNRTIKGTVKDENGTPIPAVSVTIKETKKGTSTSADGNYTIEAAQGNTLQFRYLGYKTEEITVGANNTINVSLTPSNNELSEVTVTALGIQKDNKKLGYALTTVKGEELTRTNTVNPIAALQGKVAGVNINVMSASGVQTSPSIIIRGSKVVGNQPGQANNQPIFVVDGNVLQNNQMNADDKDGGSQLKNLNPDDYESITVLKGAAATSIYGSRGLNGAVVITTKKGKMGQGLGIEFNSTYQTQDIYKSPMAMQNTYGHGSFSVREGNFAPDGSQIATAGSWGPKMDGSLHPATYDPTKQVPFSPQPDSWKFFYQNGNYINNNVALSGAGDKFNYRVSYSNNSSKGMLRNNGLKRNSVDLKMGAELNKVFSTELGISYSNTVTKNYYGQGRYYHGGGENLGFNTYYLPRNIDYNDWYANYRNPDNSTKSPGNGNLDRIIGLFSRFDKNNYEKEENSILAYTQLKAQVTPWLDFSGKLNVNFYKINTEEKNYGNEKNNKGGYYGVGGSYTNDYNILFMGHATKKINDDINLDFRLVNEIYGNRMGENWGSNTSGGLTVPNVFFLDNSVNAVQNNTYYKNGSYNGPQYPSLLTYGLGGILNLSYKDYLNLEVTGRNDWISTLTYQRGSNGANNFAVFYPSVNLSYSIYDHLKESMPNWLSSGRLRASLAYVGNAGVAGPYSTGSGYIPSPIFNQDGQSVGSANQFQANIKPNPNLKAQKQRSLELGTNFGLFKELINVDFAWYKTNTLNQLLHLEGVMETGWDRLYLNAGDIQNKGLELLVNVNPIRSKDWGLDFSVNLAHNKSKIIKFGNGIKAWELSGGYDYANVWAFEGGDFGVLTAEPIATVKTDATTGWPIIRAGQILEVTDPAQKYKVQNYQYVVNEKTQAQQYIPLGKVEPNLVGGINANLRYKNFSLFAQVDGRFGGHVYSQAYSYAMGQGTLEASLYGRDQEHGGVERTDSYNGQTRYDGVIPNVIFAAGEKSPLKPGTDIGGKTFRQAYDEGLVEPWKASFYHVRTNGWGTNFNTGGSVSKNSWIMLREITLGYTIPTSLLEKIHVRGARLNFTARNIGYLYNTLSGGQNPESLQSNDPFRPYITGGVPFYRNYAVSLNVRF
ncbi:SusC/RagA family TonB-linked outer membrane protein [Pedobacter nyackensis]|uniref:SusC/RagA family TonB-linked outer membrane protein n=1 Tax=Pedobacter nyackensis TaxID=475255 RepID=UPI00292F30C5|nr:SusC/RagA family TonB-linked outer membrane protein [Pedobacter nyackensis]